MESTDSQAEVLQVSLFEPTRAEEPSSGSTPVRGASSRTAAAGVAAGTSDTPPSQSEDEASPPPALYVAPGTQRRKRDRARACQVCTKPTKRLFVVSLLAPLPFCGYHCARQFGRGDGPPTSNVVEVDTQGNVLSEPWSEGPAPWAR